MSNPYPISAYFTVAGQKIPVSHFSLVEALSRPVELSAQLLLTEAPSQAPWVGQPVQLRVVQAGGGSRIWHLRCEETSQGWVFCRSAWAVCFEVPREPRVFCQERLPELVKRLFAEQGLPPHYTQWHLRREDWERAQLLQCAESDGEFIQRICGRENLQWFSRHDEQGETLHFVDDPTFFEPRADAVVPRQAEYMQRAPWQPQECLEDLALRLYSGIPCFQAGRGSAGMPVKSYQALSYAPDQFEKILRAREARAEDILSTGYAALRCRSPYLDIRPGQCIQAKGDYRLNYVMHRGFGGEKGKTFQYENTLIAQAASSPWRGVLNRAPQVPLVFSAMHLEHLGHERIDLHDHSTRPIPRLTPYANPRGGMQMPLYPGREVLVTCLHGELDLPVILGALYNKNAPSPVTASNPRLNILRTQQQQTLLFDDTPRAPLITLSTQSGHRWVMRNQTDPGIFIECIGGMIFSSRGQFTWETGNDFTLRAGKSFQQQGAIRQTMQTREGTIALHAGRDLALHAQMGVKLSAGGHATTVCENLSMKLDGPHAVTVSQGDAQFTVQGKMMMQVAKDITITSVSGDLTLTNTAGNCGVRLTQSGQISVFGRLILLQGDLQKNVGVMNHSG